MDSFREGKRSFRGFYGSELRWSDGPEPAWVLTPHEAAETEAETQRHHGNGNRMAFHNQSEEYPLGKKIW